ncbi:pilus assembly protein TadG-related protein, partial [Selenomonas sp.]|uniref:pilus assembly protein TadG-related protein n=1 Tax=Selenomonas sp. TaxID=2053611 RepID=UPI002A7626A1
MKNFMRSLRAALRQRGSILVLTAFALPVALAGIGLSVDAGNVYMHKSRRQNAADAAARGGAYSGRNWKTGAFDETAAGEAADGYLAENNGCDLTLKKHQLFYSTNKSTKYYAVRADEDVPTMFMKYFGYTNVSISAKSIAKLH